MNKSFAFIGTSFLWQCEKDYRNPHITEWTPRFGFETNIVQAVSERNPDHTIYNCSESGLGVEMYHKRAIELLDRYDPDVFVIEIPEGERVTTHTNNQYYSHYNMFFPVQEWKAGIPQNISEPFRDIPVPQIDSFMATMGTEELNYYWYTRTGFPFKLSETQWRGFRQVLAQMDNGKLARDSDVQAQCEMINWFLSKAKGKEVYWFYWTPPDIPNNTKNMLWLDRKSIAFWKYEQDHGRFKNPDTAKNPPQNKIEENLMTYGIEKDDTHIHSKYMPDFAPYFDEIFK